ncbi:MAG: cyclic nucleotide-binding domain-containing protein [Gammaproteobacteria bacterium]
MAELLTDPGYLRKIPVFDSLTDDELMRIIQSPDNGIEEYDAKQMIIRESEIGECMYVIIEGTVEVSIRGADALGREITIATLRAGDFFGEQSLDTDTTGRRNATVRALHPTKLFRIDKRHILLSLHNDTVDSEDITVPVMTPQDREVRDLIGGMRLFQSLNERELGSIGSWTEVISAGPGDFVLKESEKGDCLYVVLGGTVEIFTFDDDGKILILATLERGSFFGEQALMPGSDGTRNAYARSNDVARLIKIPKEYFKLILNRDSILAQALEKVGDAQKKEHDQMDKDQ